MAILGGSTSFPRPSPLIVIFLNRGWPLCSAPQLFFVCLNNYVIFRDAGGSGGESTPMQNLMIFRFCVLYRLTPTVWDSTVGATFDLGSVFRGHDVFLRVQR